MFGGSVTYDGIGTYNSFDFYNVLVRPTTLAFLPQDPSEIGPQFLLFTRTNEAFKSAQKLPFNDTSSIKSSHFNSSVATRILIHGWHNEVTPSLWTEDMKNKLLAYEDVNVIVVDWAKGASKLYGQSVVNARLVGDMVGIQVGALSAETGAILGSIQIIGHSLGAHVASYAGKRLKGNVGRITGLDPAKPFFEGLGTEARLALTDAQFVDVIHTDASVQGFISAIGHVDFYVNGGAIQPGCQDLGDILQGDFNPTGCNHERSHQLYAAAISDKVTPIAHQCNSYLLYILNECNSCGTSGEKCSILGPRAIESKGVIMTPKKHYFIKSSGETPYFNSTVIETVKN